MNVFLISKATKTKITYLENLNLIYILQLKTIKVSIEPTSFCWFLQCEQIVTIRTIKMSSKQTNPFLVHSVLKAEGSLSGRHEFVKAPYVNSSRTDATAQVVVASHLT